MAHVEHYTKTNIKNVLKEHNRELKTYKNDVDTSRSHLNWSIGISDATECYKAILSRVNDIMDGRETQTQTNLMSEWVVTYPSDLCEEVTGANGKVYNRPTDEDECKRFFEEVYAFNCERYGKDNVIGAYVHMDETTPHISMQIVPEAVSRKTGKKTVSTASRFDKKELLTYHDDLGDYLGLQLDPKFKGLIKNGRTKGDYTVREMKDREEQEKRLAERERQVQAREQAVALREQQVQEQASKLNRINDELSEKRKVLETVEKNVNEMIEKNKSIVRIQTWMRSTVCAMPTDSSFRTIQERYDEFCHKDTKPLKERLFGSVIESLNSRSTEPQRSGSGVERQ